MACTPQPLYPGDTFEFGVELVPEPAPAPFVPQWLRVLVLLEGEVVGRYTNESPLPTGFTAIPAFTIVPSGNAATLVTIPPAVTALWRPGQVDLTITESDNGVVSTVEALNVAQVQHTAL